MSIHILYTEIVVQSISAAVLITISSKFMLKCGNKKVDTYFRVLVLIYGTVQTCPYGITILDWSWPLSPFSFISEAIVIYLLTLLGLLLHLFWSLSAFLPSWSANLNLLYYISLFRSLYMI